MIDLNRITELIEEKDNIKTKFVEENITIASSYSFEQKKRINHGMPLKMIYKNPDFIEWKAELEYELGKLRQDQLLCDIFKLFGRFNGWSDDRCFSELECKLNVLKKHISDYDETEQLPIDVDDIRIPERELSEKIISALCKLQKNAHYTAEDKEDTFNDYIRDMLSGTYEVKDQTRQGESTNGHDAGEVDIQICYSGNPVVMIEALKLKSLNKTELKKHIDKVLTKYDPNGCPYAVVLVYSAVVDFNSFTTKLNAYLNEYEYPYEKKTELIIKDTCYSEIKHSQIILDRNGQSTLVHFFYVHIQNKA